MMIIILKKDIDNIHIYIILRKIYKKRFILFFIKGNLI
jgi:hypothetical protein